jgi:hypothetical protein
MIHSALSSIADYFRTEDLYSNRTKESVRLMFDQDLRSLYDMRGAAEFDSELERELMSNLNDYLLSLRLKGKDAKRTHKDCKKKLKKFHRS